jgi:SAM-dependent methyltransferase
MITSAASTSRENGSSISAPRLVSSASKRRSEGLPEWFRSTRATAPTKHSYRDRARWAEQYRTEIERWKNAYWLSHRLLGSKAEVFYGDIYDLPAELGEFDVTLVGSVLEHLSDPISALGSVARLTKERIVVVTPLLETDQPIARFEGRADNPEGDFTWWIYSLGVYREIFGMLGFAIEKVSRAKYRYMYADRDEERSTIVAVRESS